MTPDPYADLRAWAAAHSDERDGMASPQARSVLALLDRVAALEAELKKANELAGIAAREATKLPPY